MKIKNQNNIIFIGIFQILYLLLLFIDKVKEFRIFYIFGVRKVLYKVN